MAFQHLLASCLLGPVNHCVYVAFVCLTVYTGVVFGFELFLQTCLKCKFHFNFANVSTLNCFYTPDHVLFPAAVFIGKVLSQISALGLFFNFLTSHNHLQVPQSFPIIFTNLAPLASPKKSSGLGDLHVLNWASTEIPPWSCVDLKTCYLQVHSDDPCNIIRT